MKLKLKVRSGDEVVVLQGKDRGRKGRIKKVLSGKRMVIVKGINIVKKHVKAQGDQPGGILEIERPLLASKIMAICPHCHKPTRVAFRFEKGVKLRVCRRCGEPFGGGKNAS